MGACPSKPGGKQEEASAPSPYRALAFGAEGGVTTCVCAADGALYAGSDAGWVSHFTSPWRAAPSQPARSWSAHGSRAVTRLALGGGLLASASRDGTVALWRAEGGAAAAPPPAPLAVLRGHELTVSAVDLTRNGARVASGSRDCSLRVWDAGAGGREVCAPAHVQQNVVTCLKWRSEGDAAQHTILQGGEDLRVRLWDTRAGLLQAVGALEGFTYFPLALDCALDGHHVATASKGFNGVGCEVRLWDLRRMGGSSSSSSSSSGSALLRTLAGHSQDATAVLFLSGNRVASGSKDGSVRVWAREEGSSVPLVLPLPGASVTSLAACPQGLVAGCAEAHGLSIFTDAGLTCEQGGGLL